jgi:hypothetical protein
MRDWSILWGNTVWEINENGKMFTDLCAKHDLMIGGTIFPHRRCQGDMGISRS